MPANPLSDHSPSLSNRQQQRGMGANTAPGNPPGASSLQARPVGNDDRQQPTVGHDATFVAGPSQADWQQGPVEAASGPGGSMQGAAVGEEHAFQDERDQGQGEGQDMAAEGCSGQQCSRVGEPNGMSNTAVSFFYTHSTYCCVKCHP